MSEKKWEEIDLTDGPAAARWEEVDPAEFKQPLPTSTSTLSDFGTGVGQGATFGFWDEIKAALSPILKGPRTYRSEWQKLQADLEAAKKNSPNAFLAGELTGGIGSTLATAWIPGLGEANAVKTAALLPRLAQAAKTGATVGAIQGGITGVGTGGAIGAGTIGDAASGAARGGVAGALFSPAAVALGEMGPAAVNFLKEKIGKPVLQTAAPLFRVNKDVAREVIADPALYRTPAKSTRDVGSELVEKFNGFSSSVDTAREKAREMLRKSPAISYKEAAKTLENSLMDTGALFKRKIKVEIPSSVEGEPPRTITKMITDSTQPGLMEQLKKQKQYLKSLANEEGSISERELRTFMDNIKGHTSWNRTSSEATKPIANGYSLASGRFNSVLKKNEDYANAMEPIAKSTGELKDLAKALGLKRKGYVTEEDPGRYALTNNSMTKLSTLRNNPLTMEMLDNFSKKFPQTDLGSMANRVKTEKALEKAGLFTGTMAGAGSGSVPGFIAGLTRDLTGQPVWKNLATRLGPETTTSPGTFENLVTRGAASLFAQPWNPYEPQK